MEKLELEQKNIEILEKKYLDKYFYFLKYAEDEMLIGFKTKYKIRNDWYPKWNPKAEGKGISDFSVGAERVVYSLLNGKGVGQVNSSPIGSDLFFEVEDAFIHIDLKTVQTRNLNDYLKDIFIGNNQNSYNGYIDVKGKEKIYDEACLPFYYTLEDGKKKPCLTYFITILYEEINLDILNINILSMPNGFLFPIYGKKILKAGKTQYLKNNPKRETHSRTIRYKWNESLEYKLLENNTKRIKVAYLKNDCDLKIKNKLKIFQDLLKEQ